MTSNIKIEILKSSKQYFVNRLEKSSESFLGYPQVFFTNSKKISIIFTIFFVNRSSSKNSSIKLPLNKYPSMTLMLSSVDMKNWDILGIVKTLAADKAPWSYDIPIRMLNLSHKSIFSKCSFWQLWISWIISAPIEREITFQFGQNLISRLVKKCRQIFLLRICGKINEHLIFNSLLNYYLLSPYQWGFIPGDLFVD